MNDPIILILMLSSDMNGELSKTCFKITRNYEHLCFVLEKC